jgi:hypothetical protein
MVAKIYGLIWAIGILAVGATYLTGYFNYFMMLVFGFLSFSALYLGLVAVMPLAFAPHSPKKH